MPLHRPRTASPIRALPAALLCLLATACAHRGAPAAFPPFDEAQGTPSLVATRLLATGELPQFGECASPDVLCMDAPPTWMKLRNLATVYGEPPAATFYASTTSHYGAIDATAPVKGPMLMLLHSHRGQTVMARYARANLKADSAGQLHLVLLEVPPHWLPCSVATLREPITDAALAKASAITREDVEARGEGNHSEHYRLEGDVAYPKYSLPLARLKAHLAGQSLAAKDFACAPAAD